MAFLSVRPLQLFGRETFIYSSSSTSRSRRFLWMMNMRKLFGRQVPLPPTNQTWRPAFYLRSVASSSPLRLRSLHPNRQALRSQQRPNFSPSQSTHTWPANSLRVCVHPKRNVWTAGTMISGCFLATAGTALYFLYPEDLRNWIQMKSPSSKMSESNNSDARIIVLATSVAKRNYLQQFTHWLQMVWMSCQDAIFILTRSSEIVICLIPLLLLTPASMLAVSLCDVSDNTTHSRISDWTWRYTRSAITSLGPAFVKLFQWVATRRDIFPPHVCDRLSVLHDKGIPHAWLHTEQALIACFGPDYKSRGLVIDCDDDDDKVEGSKHNAALIGCGSAAQVYRGTLVSADGEWNEPSRRVAIKVLHPRLLERVTRDLTFVQAVADLVHSLPIERIRMLNLSRAVRTFGDILMRQTDLQIEAENLIQFRFNFYHNEREERNSSIRFPKPIEGWIGQTVLVEDLVDDAKPISEYLNDSTEQGLQNRRDLASPLLRAFLKMVFLDNFVHCDLHAGNVLIQSSAISDEPKNTWKQLLSKWNVRFATVPENRSSKLQIVFLDAGIAMSLSPNDQRNLLDLFRAVILNDGNQAGRLMVERARYERCTETPGGVDAFARGIEDLVDEFHVSRQKGLTLGAVRIGSLLSRVLDLCREYGVEIDPSMSSIVVSTLVLEGLGRSLEPDLNLIDFAIPFVLGRGRV